MNLDHLNIYVADVKRSRAFYEPVMRAFGYDVVRDFDDVAVGFGDGDYAIFALVRTQLPIEGVHFAFRVDSRAEVDRFYGLAIGEGGRDNGAPGLRPHYHAHYYAAFVRDEDGNNMEFVCHLAEE